jgi:fibronectin-binding autotransporter adhesin
MKSLMKRFDPQVGREGRGMSAGRNHRSLQRLLRNAAAISLFAVPVIAPATLSAQAILINGSSTYTQNFNTLATSGTSNAWSNNSTISGWYVQYNTSSSTTPAITNPTIYQADTGTVTSASLISYGSTADRALGNMTTNGTGAWAYGVGFKNNTTNKLTLGNIGYTLEQWRNSGNGTSNSISFWYQKSTSAITTVDPIAAATSTPDVAPSAAWISVSQLNSTSTINTGSAASLDGNATANRTVLSTSLSTVTLDAGEYIMFRWSDPNHSGNDHGLAIDDFSLTYTFYGNYWVGNSGVWSSSSSSFAQSSGGSTGASQATTGAIVFDTLNIAPTVSGTIPLSAGLTFGANGISIASGTINLAGASAATNTITVTNGSDTATISSALSGSNGLTKAGNGTLILSGANTYTGGLTINAGTVKLGSTGALNSTANSQNALTFGPASTGTLSVNGNSVTIASLNSDAGNAGTTIVQNGSTSAGTATLTIGNSTNADSTFAGTIRDGNTGILAINKTGSGTLTLSGANTYTGATNINQGKLVLSGGSLAAGTVSVANLATLATSGVAKAESVSLVTGATLDLTSAGLSLTGGLTATGGTLKYTFGNTLAVAGALNLSGTVNITLAGDISATTYELLTFASGSTSALKVTTTIPGWVITPSATGTNYSVVVTSSASNLNWNLASGGNWDTTTQANWYNGTPSTTQAFTNGDKVTFDKPNGGTISVIGTITPGSITVNSDGNYVFQTGTLAGTAGITKLGNGKLTLSAANTFTGRVVVNAGTLAVTNANALGATSGDTTVNSGATLDVSGAITLAAESLTLTGTGASGVGALTSSSGSPTVSSPITLSGNTLITSQGTSGINTLTLSGTISGASSTLSIGGAADTNISGIISGSGLALNKTGNGILTLSNAANTYTGLTTVSAGTLAANYATSISSSVFVGSGAMLNLKDNQTLTSIDGSGQITVALGKTFAINNNTTSAQTYGGTFNATGPSTFTKQGSGTVILSGTNTNLTRDFTISGGTVKASNNSALGTGAVLIGTDRSGSSGTVYVANNKTISNNITIGGLGNGTTPSLLAGWDFQTTSPVNGSGQAGTVAVAASSSPSSYNSSFGSGTLYLNGTNGSSPWITATTGNEVTAQAGSTLAIGAAVGSPYYGFNGNAGVTLALLGGTSQSANGKSMVFTVDMSKKTALQIIYDTQGSGTGFNSQLWEYSTDGVTWLNPQTITTPSAFATKTLNTVNTLDGDSTVFVRLTLSGATGSTGNNRLDNIAFMANADVPTGSGTLGIDEAGTATFTGNITVNNTATLYAVADGTAVFKTGVISGSATSSIIKTGDGRVELQGANTFKGSLTLTAGNLKVSTLAAVGVASPLGQAADDVKTIIFNGGKFEYAGTVKGVFNRDFTVGSGGAGFISSGTAALEIDPTAQMDFQDTTSGYRTLSLGGTSEIAVENIYNPTKIATADVTKLFTKLVKQDTNKWIVKGAGAGFVDDASTEMNIDGGELDFEMGALGSKSTINVGTATLSWYNSSNTEDLSGRIHLNTGAAAVFNIPSGNTVTFASALNGGAVTTASLTKLGEGTLILGLGAENKFSGNFNISAGTVNATNAKSLGTGNVIVGPGNKIDPKATLLLSLNPTAVIANKINVISGGTLAGTGTDEDATIEEDGILSPNADSVGTLSFKKLTLNGGSTVKWQLKDAAGAAGVGYDTLVVTLINFNNISSSKKVKITVANSGTLNNFDKSKKFEFAKLGTPLALGTNVTDLFTIDANQFEIDNNLVKDHLVWSMQLSADRDVMYITTMIPEPSTYGLGLSALALAVVAVRRRKKKKV